MGAGQQRVEYCVSAAERKTSEWQSLPNKPVLWTRAHPHTNIGDAENEGPSGCHLRKHIENKNDPGNRSFARFVPEAKPDAFYVSASTSGGV